jgi:periplasmic copper chaperone A
MYKPLIVVLLTALTSTQVAAQVTVKDPWIRATVPQQKASGAFMQITAAQDTRLVEAKSPVAGVVEIHEMKMENNVMKMRAVPGVDVPAGKAVDLKPGGYHVMLMDLKEQMKEGATVPVTLVFEGKDKKRETVEVKATVRPLAGGAAKKEEHKHDHAGHKH